MSVYCLEVTEGLGDAIAKMRGNAFTTTRKPQARRYKDAKNSLPVSS